MLKPTKDRTRFQDDNIDVIYKKNPDGTFTVYAATPEAAAREKARIEKAEAAAKDASNR